MNVTRHNAVLLFTRFPTPGRAKTRLIPTLGTEGAARLQREMTELIVTRLRPAAIRGRFQLTACHAGASSRSMCRWLGQGLAYEPQSDGDLGERMSRAIQTRFEQGAGRVVVIGADCPGVTKSVLEQAFAAIESHSVVFGPAHDGGYYLVGLNRPQPTLFQGLAWGGDTVLRDSLSRARQLGLEPALLPTLTDIDRPEDLTHWEAARREASTLAVIIPVLNEAANLADTLERVARGQPGEIIVADGGSTDGSLEIARQSGARVLEVPRGRGRQLNAAAAVASSQRLLFLHADTWPPVGYADAIGAHLNHPAVAAGAFRFALREPFPGRRLIEGLVSARCRWFGGPYGDQGLFLRRDLFEALGGFVEWPLLEDVEILSRLRRHGRIVVVRSPVMTSARRWLERGVWRTCLVNQLVMLGYHGGVSRERLARFYHQAGR